MALLETAALGNRLVEDVDLDGSVEVVDSANVSKLYAIRINNDDNDVFTYVRLWDASSSPTNGTTDPDWILPVPPSSTRTFTFGAGLQGVDISNSLYMAGVSNKGKTGSDSPTNNVKGDVVIDA